MLENRTEPMQEQAWWRLHCASCLLVFCAVVWCCWLVAKWVMEKKNIQTYPYYNCTFHHQNSQRKQTNFTVPTDLIENFGQHNLLHVSLSACWKTGQNPYKNKHGEDCMAQVVCWHFVRLCGAAGVGGEVSDEKKTIQTHPYSNCIFHHQNLQRKQTSFTVPTNLIENFDQHNLLYVSLSACWKTGQNPCKNKHGENCIAQVVCWYFVRLCGAAGVGCEVSEGKKTIQTYPYSNCTFHHQSSQRKQTSFTVPTDLGKTLANIICCMCLFQHFGKQDRTHTRTSMVKIALRKLFAGILCGCVVLLVLVVKWVSKNNPNTSIFELHFHHQNSQRKQTSFKVPANLIENFDQHNLLYVSLSACWKTGQNPCKNTHGEDCIAQVVCWYFVRLCGAAGVGCEVSDEKKTKPIHILTALFTTGIHKEYKQVLTYRPTSWKPWPTSSTVRVSVTTFENRTGSMQEQIWSKLHCASCLLAFCAVVWCCLFVAKWVREKNHPNLSIF